jgi:hypothetical protein
VALPRRHRNGCAAAAAADLHGEGPAADWGSVEEARAARREVRPPERQWAREEVLAAFLVRGHDGRYRLRQERGPWLVEVDVDSGHIRILDAPAQTAAVVRAARTRTRT